MSDEFTYQWEPYDAQGNFIEDGPILKVTKSSLNTFYWCNKQYQYSYIERRPQDTSEAMLKGTIVHNSYEDFYKAVDVEAIQDYSKDELQEHFISLFPVSKIEKLTFFSFLNSFLKFINFAFLFKYSKIVSVMIFIIYIHNLLID